SVMGSPEIAAAKMSLRRHVLARRGRHSDVERAQIAAALATAFAAEFGSRLLGAGQPGEIVDVHRPPATANAHDAAITTVALYLSFATEPGTGPVIDWLTGRRVRALAPTLLPDADLGWMDIPDGPPLGLDAIIDAQVILVPALAIDPSGHRLGRGGGSYDRALTRVRPGQTVLAVVHDDEVFDVVPFEPHDRIVDGALTPSGVRYF
ncbi:MAG TPA: 5-formyltetrahydrofolate cyclo-ligase, partial [Acidothermaceae bacterium]